MKGRVACCIALAHILSLSHAEAQTQSPRQEYRTTANQETVLQSELVSVPSKEATVLRVELPAGWIGDSHYDTGDVFVYVLSGEFVVDVDNQGRKRFGPGQVYHEGGQHDDAGSKPECDSTHRTDPVSGRWQGRAPHASGEAAGPLRIVRIGRRTFR
jgi:quercetin dioxygenase-like cupin family protein